MLAEGQPAAGSTPLRVLSIGLLVLAAALATYTRADADLWGHVRFGLDTLGTRTLTSVDPYSFTQDKPWVNHEWLSEADDEGRVSRTAARPVSCCSRRPCSSLHSR